MDRLLGAAEAFAFVRALAPARQLVRRGVRRPGLTRATDSRADRRA
jgi:hypothetical protein